MTFRIALAGLHMECASFLPQVTGRDVFEAGTARGADLIARYEGSNTVMGGFLREIAAEGAEAVPILHADGGAAGLADQSAVVGYRNEIVTALAGMDGHLDGLLVHLHGAMVTQAELDPDAQTLNAIRAAVGPNLPIMVAFDYHANLDAGSIAGATAAFGYRYSPHIDMGATGARAARCLFRTLTGDIQPAMAIARPGLILPSIFSATDLLPLKNLVAEAVEQSEDTGTYQDISVFAGFAYADVPNCGASVIAVVDGARNEAGALARKHSAKIAAQRAALSAPAPVFSLEDGVRRALAKARTATRPVVLLEHADRANDSTHGLRALLRMTDHERIAVPFLWDPISVTLAMAAGEGARVSLQLGGHSAPLAGEPVSVMAKVINVKRDFVYRGTGQMRAGSEVRLGDTVLLDVDGLLISITSLSESAIDFDPFLQFDLDPADFDIVLLRSKTHFRAAWEGFAAEIIIVDTPDYGPADLSRLAYSHAHVDAKS